MSVKNNFVPKYKQLFNLYRQKIIQRKLLPGDKIDSITEIQEKHAVARETAKTVLRMLAEEGLIVKKPGMGSFVQEQGSLKKQWGLVLPFYSVQYTELISHLDKCAREQGREIHHYIDYNNYQEELRIVGELIQQRYEAVIIIPTLDESKTAEFYRTLTPRDSFITLLDHTSSGSFFSYVIQSYDLGVKRGMQYLLEKTRKNIAFIRNRIWTGRNIIEELMEATFFSIMENQSKQRKAVSVLSIDMIDPAFIQENKIDGFFCCDDSDAIRLLGRLKEEDLLPQRDFYLVSYGNSELARFFTPAITSINPHNRKMAQITMDIICKQLDGNTSDDQQWVVQPSLIVRET